MREIARHVEAIRQEHRPAGLRAQQEMEAALKSGLRGGRVDLPTAVGADLYAGISVIVAKK